MDLLAGLRNATSAVGDVGADVREGAATAPPDPAGLARLRYQELLAKYGPMNGLVIKAQSDYFKAGGTEDRLHEGLKTTGGIGFVDSVVAPVVENVIDPAGDIVGNLAAGTPENIPGDLVDTPLGDAVGDAASAVGDAVGGLADAAGLSAPDTSGIKGQQGKTQDWNDYLKGELGKAGTATAPTVTAATIDPAAQVTAAQIDPTERVQAATIDPVERAAAERAAAIAAQDKSGIGQRQMALMEQLQARANGEGGPSAAEAQLKMGLESAQKQALSLAAGARGQNRGAALRAGLNKAGDLNLQGNQQLALLRAQEQQQAAGQLSDVMQGARGQELQLALANAAAANQANLTNAGRGTEVSLANAGAANTRNTNQAQLTQSAATTNAGAANTRATNQAELNQGAAVANAGATNTRATNQAQLTQRAGESNQGAAVTTAGQNIQERSGVRQDIGQGNATAMNGAVGILNAEEAGKARRTGLIGNIAGAAGTALAGVSDARAKTDIVDLLRSETRGGGHEDALRTFLEDLHPYAYRYKDPAADGEGPRVGVMAQDLERNPVGRTVVREGADGKKMIDTAAAVGVTLAALAKMREEMDTLKARRK